MVKTTMADLHELLTLVTRSYSTRISTDLDDGIPTDAATLSGAVKLLKDNECTADPADKDDLNKLRDELKAANAARRQKRVGSVLQAVTDDFERAVGE